jgi:undecaprenyl pyrophosphate phosphatase UppP
MLADMLYSMIHVPRLKDENAAELFLDFRVGTVRWLPSRSMSTIASGQLAGMSRASALEFSFFLSMPTMGAATLFALYKSLHTGRTRIRLALEALMRTDGSCWRLDLWCRLLWRMEA